LTVALLVALPSLLNAGEIISAPVHDVRFRLAASLTSKGWDLVDPDEMHPVFAHPVRLDGYQAPAGTQIVIALRYSLEPIGKNMTEADVGFEVWRLNRNKGTVEILPQPDDMDQEQIEAALESLKVAVEGMTVAL
jgi:hypothetical protein